MNSITAKLNGVSIYHYDVIFHAPSLESQNERLCELLKRSCQYNVNLNLSKCIFATSKFTCLGFLVTADGFKPDPDRFLPLSNASSPKTSNEFGFLMGSLQC